MTRVWEAIRTVDSRQTGGPEELLLSACPLLRQRGEFQPAILLLRKPNPNADLAKDFGNRARAIHIPVLPLQGMRWRPGWLGSLPARMGIDIIHVHGQRANYFVWLMRRLFPRTWGRLPLVATVHGWVQDNFLRRVVTRLEWGTLRDCDHIITVSELQKKTLASMGFDPRKVSVVRPGIAEIPPVLSTAEAARQRAEAREHWGIPQGAYVISAVGRLSTEKRFDLYLQVCAKLASEIPEAVFMLVGGGKQDANLRALAAQLGLQDRVVFTGLTREMASVYAATDLVMITSDTEGIPHMLLEAMSRGIPVVSTAVGGIPEVVTPGRNGLLVPAGDVKALADAAMHLHSDRDFAGQLSAEGRALAHRFTSDSLVEGMEEVYRSLTVRRSNSERTPEKVG